MREQRFVAKQDVRYYSGCCLTQTAQLLTRERVIIKLQAKRPNITGKSLKTDRRHYRDMARMSLFGSRECIIPTAIIISIFHALSVSKVCYKINGKPINFKGTDHSEMKLVRDKRLN
jgi:hypothetical protein